MCAIKNKRILKFSGAETAKISMVKDYSNEPVFIKKRVKAIQVLEKYGFPDLK